MNMALEKVFKKNCIEGIVFDLDSTLTDTYSWLYEEYSQIADLITEHINTQYSKNIEKNIIRKAYWDSELIEYKNGNVSFTSRFPSTVKRIINILELENQVNQEEIVEQYIDNVKQIYHKAPPVYEGTLELIHNLQFSNIVICTHSGKKWTDIKMERINKEYEQIYGCKPQNILTYPIELEDDKDEKSWINAGNLISDNLLELVSVGDSFTADILPSAQAGYKYIVWITNYSEDKKEDIKQLRNLGINIEIIEHIKDLENLLTSNRLFEDI
jgi:FMN phosphatase YigB (HAD superfamily)